MLQYLLRGKVFCESLLVPVQHFISQYDQLHDITGCHGYNTVSQCWVFVKTLATINAQEQTACWCGIQWFHHHVHKSLIMDHILSQLKPAPSFISYFSLTHFNIILLPTHRTPTQWFLQRYSLLIYFMHVTCLGHLISDFISRNIRQRGCTVSLLNFINPPSIFNVPPHPPTPHQKTKLSHTNTNQQAELQLNTPPFLYKHRFWTHTQDQTSNGKEYTYVDPHL